jgi:hypothetical protein
MFGGWKDRFKFNGQNFSQNDFKRILREGGNHFGLDLPQFVADDALVKDLGNVTELILDILTRRDNESIDALVREIARRLGTFGTGTLNEDFFRRLFAALKARYDMNPASLNEMTSSYTLPPPRLPVVVPPEVLAPPRPLPLPRPLPALPPPPPLLVPAPALPIPALPIPLPAPAPGYLDALDRIVDFGAPRAPAPRINIETAIIDCWSMEKIQSEYQRRYFQAYRNVLNGKLGVTVQNYEEILMFAFFDIETKRMDGATPAESIRNFVVALKKTMRFSFEKMGDFSARLSDAERQAVDERYQRFLAAINRVIETIE